MAMKGCSAFPKAPALLTSRLFSITSGYSWAGVLPSAKMQSMYPTAPADWARQGNTQLGLCRSCQNDAQNNLRMAGGLGLGLELEYTVEYTDYISEICSQCILQPQSTGLEKLGCSENEMQFYDQLLFLNE